LISSETTASAIYTEKKSAAKFSILEERLSSKIILPPYRLHSFGLNYLQKYKPREMWAPSIRHLTHRLECSKDSRVDDSAHLFNDLMALKDGIVTGTLRHYFYMSREARLWFLLDASKAAEDMASASFQYLSYFTSKNSEETLFCEETLALAAYRSCGWSKTNSALEDVAHRAGLLYGQLSLQAMSALANRAAIASEVGARALSLELHKLLVKNDVKAYGFSHRFTINDRLNLAVETALAGDLVHALSLSRSCEEDALDCLGSSHPLRCMAAARTGQILSALGESYLAVMRLRFASSLHAVVFGDGHHRTLDCRTSEAFALLRCGSLKKAKMTLRAASRASEPVSNLTPREAEDAEGARERLWFLMEIMGIH
jgi:hypothetical protein